MLTTKTLVKIAKAVSANRPPNAEHTIMLIPFIEGLLETLDLKPHQKLTLKLLSGYNEFWPEEDPPRLISEKPEAPLKEYELHEEDRKYYMKSCPKCESWSLVVSEVCEACGDAHIVLIEVSKEEYDNAMAA